jgi:transcriptional regulator GlxA family with amidase domain
LVLSDAAGEAAVQSGLTVSARLAFTGAAEDHLCNAGSMLVAIPLFPRFTALDGIGPYEVLQRIPGYDIRFVGHERGVVRSDNGFLGIEVDARFDEVPRPDVIVFPGGIGTRALLEDDAVLDWIRAAHKTTLFTTSVCTGSLVLAAAGLLEGLTATTHWAARDILTRYGAVVSEDRVVEHVDQRIISAAGVSSGIDMALRLVELLVDRTAAEAAQLMIEYDPQPPFDAGTPRKAGGEVIERVAEYAASRD